MTLNNIDYKNGTPGVAPDLEPPDITFINLTSEGGLGHIILDLLFKCQWLALIYFRLLLWQDRRVLLGGWGRFFHCKI